MSADNLLMLYPTELRRKVRSLDRERDELLATLKLLFKAWDCNWIHPDERAQIYKQVLSVIQRAEGGE